MADLTGITPVASPIIPDDIWRALDELGLNIQIGDVFINQNTYYGLQEVVDFYWYHYADGDKRGKTLYVKTIQYGTDPANERNYKSITAKDFIAKANGNCEWYKLYDTPANVKKDALAIMADPSLMESAEEKAAAEAASTALSMNSGEDMVRRAEALLVQRHTKAAVLKATIENMMKGIQHQLSEVSKQLEYTRAVLEMLETYLGVYEKIIKIREGAPASERDPIYIHQLVQYMDEVCAILSTANGQKGIDYQRIPEFDEWLLKDDHWKKLLPFSKGIIALKPSRQNRRYSENWLQNLIEAGNNEWTYLLIRNGETLFRVWTSMKIADRLFPTNDEWNVLMKELQADEERFSPDMRAKHQELSWRQQAVLIEGLMNRTPTLNPVPAGLTLFKPEWFERGSIVMIRDAEPSLGDGRMRYSEWKRIINSRITAGTRVAFSEYNGSYKPEDLAYHFVQTYKNYPPPPRAGIYHADDLVKSAWGGMKIKIMYMPSDEVIKYGKGGEYWYEPRKVRIGWVCGTDAEYVLNYDAIRLEDLEYYLNSPLERPQYLEILPLLLELRQGLWEERKAEEPFVDLVIQETGCDPQDVWETIRWWKLKVNHHRYLTDDDQKAWRMITKEIKAGRSKAKTLEPLKWESVTSDVEAIQASDEGYRYVIKQEKAPDMRGFRSHTNPDGLKTYRFSIYRHKDDAEIYFKHEMFSVDRGLKLAERWRNTGEIV